MSRSNRLICVIAAAVACAAFLPAAVRAESLVKVGLCVRTLSAALAAPFAVATKLGWFAEDGIRVELVPLPGSTDCVKFVATKELPFSQPSIEPLAIIRRQGVRAKLFYTSYQSNVFGIRVPADSPIRTIADLKGKTVGVTSMASAGFIIARALAEMNGLNPDVDLRIVVAGEAAQTAALLRARQIDALSQFDTQYALVENAGVKLRALDNGAIEHFPSNGLIALEETLRDRRTEAVALGRGLARGTLFTLSNPEAALRIAYEVYPQTKAAGKDEATALRDDLNVLVARMENWKLDKAGVARWGESSEAHYRNYLDFLLKWGVIKQPVRFEDVVTNDLVDDINRFDQGVVVRQAKAYK